MDKFSWTNMYSELATELLRYKNDRSSLVAILQNIFMGTNMKYPYTDVD